jgi:Domain of unknown function (DUF4160)
MATIMTQDGFQVMIFTNDHQPAHVHVFKAGTEAVINLVPVRIRENYRMSKKNLRKAVEIVAGNQGLLRQAWREIHGDE